MLSFLLGLGLLLVNAFLLSIQSQKSRGQLFLDQPSPTEQQVAPSKAALHKHIAQTDTGSCRCLHVR